MPRPNCPGLVSGDIHVLCYRKGAKCYDGLCKMHYARLQTRPEWSRWVPPSQHTAAVALTGLSVAHRGEEIGK